VDEGYGSATDLHAHAETTESKNSPQVRRVSSGWENARCVLPRSKAHPAAQQQGASIRKNKTRAYFFPHFIASMSLFISPFVSDFIDDIECMAPPPTGIMACA